MGMINYTAIHLLCILRIISIC